MLYGEILKTNSELSLVMRKPAFCICKNRDADQIRGNCEADQHLCFHFRDSTIPRLSKSEIFKALAIFCDCPVWFGSNLIGNPEDRFSNIIINPLFLANYSTTHPIDKQVFSEESILLCRSLCTVLSACA